MIKAALVGVGDVSVVHLDAIGAIEDAELVALVETDPERAVQARDLGVPVFDDHLEMYRSIRPDVVHVTTPHHQHAPVAVDLLEAGANVLLEKPLANSRSAADAIIAAADKATGKLGVCFQNRYNASSVQLKKLIDSGELGDIKGAWANVVWTRTAEYYARRPWRGKLAEAGSGVLINQSIHTLDLLQWLLGDVVSVAGDGTTTKFADVIEVEDTATAYIRHAGGAESTFFATLNTPVHRPVEIEIWGSDAQARISEGLTVTFFDTGRTEFTPDQTSPTAGRSYWGYSHELLIRDFYSQLETDEPFWISAREADATMHIIGEVFRSGGHLDHPLVVG
ncbi:MULTISPECIES: Gfo/Idh/MocA family protein [Aestuariimicrobium]|uniref:Gfo/Idh/MocA family protein n=1 Tax=Aestuariimicrobium TaxID=396388 RepID=UPI000403C871|nr:MULTISPECIES: Gfo/Idh/MocA family oxidoreductase [Aestuariimicrobium]CAI9403267.1 D-apiose dehydrogenase [Aestuariimicrobium sp. T2.26MG-19.2B]